MKKTTQKQIFSLFLILAFVGSTVTFAILNTVAPEDENEVWAVRISIVIFEELERIPADVGIDGDNRDRLFTIDSDNLVYKNVPEDLMLKDFFEIWGETFNSTCILDNCNVANHSLRMYVNDVEKFDFELYTMKSMDNIIIDYR
jgi:hypothetical protein